MNEKLKSSPVWEYFYKNNTKKLYVKYAIKVNLKRHRDLLNDFIPKYKTFLAF